MMQVSESHQAERTQADPLATSLQRLHQALVVDTRGRDRQWAEVLGSTLAQVEKGLRRHRTGAQVAHEVLADEPRATLARQVKRVRNDYDELLVQVVALREDVRHAQRPRARPSVRMPAHSRGSARSGQAKQLLAGLQHNRETETRLLQESINTDIGVGD